MIAFLFSFIINAHATTPFFTDLENFKTKSLNLQSEKQILDASDDQLTSRKLFWTPKLSVSGNQRQSKVNSLTTENYSYLEADATLNLFRGGGDWNLYKEAKAQNKAQQLQVLNESLRIETRASDLIFKSIYLNESQRIQEQLLKLKEESLKIVSDRFHQGKLPLQEVSKSEVDLTQQKNRWRTTRLDYLENKSQMASLFVVDVSTNTWPFNEKTTARLRGDETIPLSDQKYWQSESRQQIWKATQSGHWPTLDLVLAYTETPINQTTTKQLTGLLTLTLPIWNQYDTSAKVSAAYAQYVTALNEYKDTEQTLKQRVLFLKDKIETARMTLLEAKKNSEASRKLYQDILKGFRLGRISTNDLFIEQNRLLDSENTLALSQLTFHQSLVESCVLAGVTSAECLNSY